MAKDTFIIRTEWWEAISELETVEQAIIFQNLFHYHLGEENLINLNNLSVKLVWKMIQPNLKRNIDSYDRRKETSALNGAKGGRPSKNQEVKQEYEKPNNLNEKPIETKKPIESLNDSVSVSDSVPVSDPVPVIENDISSSIEEVPFLEFEVVGEEKPNPLETLGSDTAFLKKKKAAVKEKKWPLAEMEKEWDKLLQKKFEVSYYPNGKERAALAQIAQKLLFQVTEKERRTGNIAMQTEHEKILGAWGYLLGRHEHWGKWHSTVKELSIINSHLTTILTNSKNGNQQTSGHGKSVAAEAIAILQRDSQQRG